MNVYLLVIFIVTGTYLSEIYPTSMKKYIFLSAYLFSFTTWLLSMSDHSITDHMVPYDLHGTPDLCQNCEQWTMALFCFLSLLFFFSFTLF